MKTKDGADVSKCANFEFKHKNSFEQFHEVFKTFYYILLFLKLVV